jgi:hypothetical protein
MLSVLGNVLLATSTGPNMPFRNEPNSPRYVHLPPRRHNFYAYLVSSLSHTHTHTQTHTRGRAGVKWLGQQWDSGVRHCYLPREREREMYCLTRQQWHNLNTQANFLFTHIAYVEDVINSFSLKTEVKATFYNASPSYPPYTDFSFKAANI